MMVRQARMLTRGSVLRMCSRRSLKASSRWGVKGFIVSREWRIGSREPRRTGIFDREKEGVSTQGRATTNWRSFGGHARGVFWRKWL